MITLTRRIFSIPLLPLIFLGSLAGLSLVAPPRRSLVQAAESAPALTADQQNMLLQRHAPVWITHGTQPNETDKLWPICNPSYLFAHSTFVRHPKPGEDVPCKDVPAEIVHHPDLIVGWLKTHSEQTADMALKFDDPKALILGEVSNGARGKDRRVQAEKEAIAGGRGAFGAVHDLGNRRLSLQYSLLFTFNEGTFADFDGAKHEGDGNHYADVVAIDLTVDASDLQHTKIVQCYMHNHGRCFDATACFEKRGNSDGTERVVVYLEAGSNEAHPNGSDFRGFPGHPAGLLANKWFKKGKGYESEWKISNAHGGKGYVYDTKDKVRDLQNPAAGDLDCQLLMLFRGCLGGSFYQPEIMGVDVGPLVDSPPSPRWQSKMWDRAFKPNTFVPMPK